MIMKNKDDVIKLDELIFIIDILILYDEDA